MAMMNFKYHDFLQKKNIYIHYFCFLFFTPLPFADFANKDGSISSLVRPFTENNRSALSLQEPPHFNPLFISSDFNLSNPKSSSSDMLLTLSKSIGPDSWNYKNMTLLKTDKMYKCKIIL